MDSKINNLISSLYQNKLYGELEALSVLINPTFILGLENILNSHAIKTKYFRSTYKVSLGWIDKIPLAKFVNVTLDHFNHQIKDKVELGDLIIISSSHDLTNKRNLSRASIIQAKISSNVNPLVPITAMSPNNSTTKELALLSEWPTFDLYRTSGSHQPELCSLDINNDKRISKYIGYYNKTWFCGEPNLNAPCSSTLGELFKKIIKNQEGKEFTLGSTSSDWERLINKILNLCNSYNLPKSHYGNNAGLRLVENLTTFFGRIPPSKGINNNYSLTSGDEERRFPIIFIESIQVEGEKDVKKYFS